MATAAEKFRIVYGDITNVLSVGRESCLIATNRFYSKKLIGEPLRREICSNSGVTAVNLLLDGLHAAIERDPKYLVDVVEVLSEDHPSLCVAFKKMNEEEGSNPVRLPVSVAVSTASCSTEPHIQPNEVVSLLEDKVQSNPDAVLAVNDLSSKFDSLYTLASSSLQHIKLEDLKVPLESKLSRTSKEVKDRFCPLLKGVTSTPQFFSFLLEHKFCGFLNFNLLSIFTKRFGSESLKEEMSQYEASYRSFSKAIKMKDLLDSILNNPSISKPLAPIGLPMIENVLEESWYSRSYSSFLEVMSSIYTWFGSSSMMFSDIRKNCIIVNYGLFGEEGLEVVSEDVTSREKKLLLRECGITVVLHTGAKSKLDEKQGKSRLHKFEESVTCPLCKELFKDPKVLSCHHSFCLDCLQRVKKTEEGSILCPVCRKGEKLPQEGVRGLPAAHHLTSIIEVAQILNIKDTTSSESASSKECSSDDCEKVPVAWCANECGYLCEKCMKGHSKMRITKNHDVRLIKELQKEQDIPLYCKHHKKQYRQYHCMGCNDMVCPECLQYCCDCQKLVCDGCLKEHGYPDDPEDSSMIRKGGLHSVYFLKNLIKHGKAREVELEKEESELKSLDEASKLYVSNLKSSIEKMGKSWSNRISSRRDDCKKGREELGTAGQTANHFISGDRMVSSPERTFQVLMEYSSSSAATASNDANDSNNSEGSSPSQQQGVSKMWLYWPSSESQSLEMIEKIQPHHIKVTFPVNPFRASKDNWFHVSLNNLLPVRPSGNPLLPVVSIKGVLTSSNYSQSIKLVGNMTWFVLFNANESKIEIDVSIDGVHPQGSPFSFHADPDNINEDVGYTSVNNDAEVKYEKSISISQN